MLHRRQHRLGSLEKECKNLSISEREEDSRMYQDEGKRGGVAALDFDDEDDDMNMIGTGGSAEDNYFDEVVGAIESILIDPEFSQLQRSYCLKHCSKFDATEENKLCYTDIFDDYTELLESNIESRLCKMIPGFQLSKFAAMCQQRRDEMTGDVFDLLLSFSDFNEFKELILSHKEPSHVPGFFCAGV